MRGSLGPTMHRHLPRSSRLPVIHAFPLAGFSLVELLIVVAIAGILLGVAAPSLGGLLATQRAVSVGNSFLSSLHLARSEAIKRNGRAVMCKSADAWQCTATGGWEQGWLVFHDTNNNAQHDAGELVVLQQAGSAAGIQLRGNGPVASYVSYSASGAARLVSGAFQAGTVTLCPQGQPGTAAVRRIIIGAPGRPRIVPGTATDCA